MIGGRSRMVRLTSFILTVMLFLGARTLSSEPPKLDFLFPPGAERGTTITLTLGGKQDVWPVKIWSDAEGIVFEPMDKNGEMKVQIPEAVPLGAHLIRIYHDDGASPARSFLIEDLPDMTEAEPNDDYRSPQKIEKTPVVVNGRLDKGGDADSFAINLAAGQWLVAKVEGYGIGSPIDPSLHVRDADGHHLADAYDTQNLDSLLAFCAEKEGTYILQIDAFAHIPRFDVRLFGTEAAVYRISIHTGPFVHHVFPLGVAVGSETELRLHGWNLPNADGAPPSMKFAAPNPSGLSSQGVSFVPVSCGELAENRPEVALSSHPQAVEAEPNDSRETAQKLGHPVGISGLICPANDTDWFTLECRKGEAIKFTLFSASLGFGLDPVLSIYGADGKSLANSDDANNSWDPELTWSAPEDGTYHVQIVDRYGMGAEEFVYYLEAAELAPRPEARVEKGVLRLDAGTTSTLKVSVARIDGYSRPLIVTAVDLPEGVLSTSAAVPEKGGDAILILGATPLAKPFNGPFRVLLLSTDPAAPNATVATVSLEVELPVGRQLIEQTANLWLTVIEKKAELIKTDEVTK